MKAIGAVLAICLLSGCVPAFAQGSPVTPASPLPSPPAGETSAELAKKLNNPVAAMISVPVQNDFDSGMGPNEDGYRYTMNIKTLIPFALGHNWNLISRTVAPFIHQSEVVGTASQTGVGDISQSFFFGPQHPKRVIWGVGPALLIPSASDKSLGSGKLGIGPTLVLLRQQKGWTCGLLTNHVWSIAGDNKRADVSSTYLQPWVAYTTRTAWTISINTESTYDWKAEKWSVPIHFLVSKLVHLGTQPMSFGVGPRCWGTSPVGGPQGCVVRFSVTALFPKKPS